MFASVVMRVKGKTIRLPVLILMLLYKCLAAFTAVETVRIVRGNYITIKVCRVKLCQQILFEQTRKRKIVRQR